MDESFSLQAMGQLILDNIDSGIAVYDTEGNYLFVNAALIKWRNISRQKFLSMNVHDFVNVLDICVFDLVCQQKTRVSRLQFYQNLQPGDPRTVPPQSRIVTGIPIFDGLGNIKYVITILQDIHRFESLYHSLLAQNKTDLGQAIRTDEQVSIIANSTEFKQLLSVAQSVAQMDSTVLLYGESGTGKEVLAHFIHDNSTRKNKPMITVNCAAIPESLIEAELFGYEKGSFTGASQYGKKGLVEAADGGTLFLDEINSLPLNIQGKMLRVIEEKSVQRVGSVKAKNVDFRLITATNKDLFHLVRQGAFREDLYYRLHVVPLFIPPLRSRKDDIAPLCLHFLQYYCDKYHLEKSFSNQVLDVIREYPWPGNVRELRNFVERIVVMTPNMTNVIYSIPTGMLEWEPDDSSSPLEDGALDDSSGRLSKSSILSALKLCNNHRGRTAEYLGISRRYLQYKIKEYHIPSRCRYDNKAE